MAERSIGNHDKSTEYYHKGIELTDKLFGDSHPNKIGLLNNISDNYLDKKLY